MEGLVKPTREQADSSSSFLAGGALCIAVSLCMGLSAVVGMLSSFAVVAFVIMTMLDVAGAILLVTGLRHQKAQLVSQTNHLLEQERCTQASVAEAENEQVGTPGAAKPPVLSVDTQPEMETTSARSAESIEKAPLNVEEENGADDIFSGVKSNLSQSMFGGWKAHESISQHLANTRMATMERMIMRSTDVFATAKDVASSGNTLDAFSDLANMLKQSDALKLPHPPIIRPIKLSRNDRFWLGTDVREIPDDVYDAVISLEAAFNIACDILKQSGDNPSEYEQLDTIGRAKTILRAVGKIEPDYTSMNHYLSDAYPQESAEKIAGEWALRMAIANAVESAALPFRVVFDMKTNAAEGFVLIQLQVPRPTCFSIITTDSQQQAAIARDYAFRSAFFMAKVAMGALHEGYMAHQAIVTCHTRGNPNDVLSLEATPNDMRSLKQIAHEHVPLVDLDNECLRIRPDHNWLEYIQPHISATNPLFYPDRYAMHVELSPRSCSEALEEATHAHRESDLGVDEDAARHQAWTDHLEGKLGDTAESAVAATRALYESTDDKLVHAACDRMMHALVDGTAEPGQAEQLESIFMGNADLSDALTYGAMAYASRQQHEIEKAITKLSEAITPSMRITMMDDTETVFRYFRNTAERVVYNLHYADKRQVRMVPINYFAANEMAAHLLCTLNRPDEAKPYVDEIMRIAPISASAAATKARLLEEQSRMFEAIDLINGTISKCSTVHDAALCYYRMAYLQWRTGNHTAAEACYRMSISLHGDVSAESQSELDKLLETDADLKDMGLEEAMQVLKKHGVTIWSKSDRNREIARAAVLCADELLYPAAQQLCLALLEFSHDDALIDVCRSFSLKN